MNIHLYQSSFRHETRMLKITKSLVDNEVFTSVTILARHERDLAPVEQLDEFRRVVRLQTFTPQGARGGNRTLALILKILGTLEWLVRAMLFVVFSRAKCVNCHSLMTLPIGVVAKLLRGVRLVYDTHELETETGNLNGFRKRMAKLTERFCIRWVDDTIVVGEAIARWYRRAYPGLSVHVVRNLPYRKSETDSGSTEQSFRIKFKIPNDAIVFLYQGVLGTGRGIHLLMEALEMLGDSHHLVFMGYGPLEQDIKDAATTARNIHFHPAVPPQELAAYTRYADVGVCIIENICLSYYYSLPNKLFEYLQSGLPIIASRFPEMSSIVDSLRCGWSTDVSPEAVCRTLSAINREDVVRKQAEARKVRDQYCWEVEESRLLAIYGVQESRKLTAAGHQRVA